MDRGVRVRGITDEELVDITTPTDTTTKEQSQPCCNKEKDEE